MSDTIPPIAIGDEIVIDLTFTNVDGSAIDISGHLLTATVKLDLAATDVPATQLKVTAPNNATSQAGKISLVLTSALTGAVAPGEPYLGLRKIIPGSPVRPWTFFQEPVTFFYPAGRATA